MKPTLTTTTTARALSGLVFFVQLALLGVPTPLAAEDPDGWSYRLAHEIMSPWCPGLSLSDCPSTPAAELRVWIIEQERHGRTRSETEALLLESYGDTLRQTPEPQGAGLLAYAIPALALLLGGVAVAILFHRAGRSAQALPVPSDPQDSA